jgi:hypothetical protein
MTKQKTLSLFLKPEELEYHKYLFQDFAHKQKFYQDVTKDYREVETAFLYWRKYLSKKYDLDMDKGDDVDSEGNIHKTL